MAISKNLTIGKMPERPQNYAVLGLDRYGTMRVRSNLKTEN
jgi:hypothetical protein